MKTVFNSHQSASAIRVSTIADDGVRNFRKVAGSILVGLITLIISVIFSGHTLDTWGADSAKAIEYALMTSGIFLMGMGICIESYPQSNEDRKVVTVQKFKKLKMKSTLLMFASIGIFAIMYTLGLHGAVFYFFFLIGIALPYVATLVFLFALVRYNPAPSTKLSGGD